MRSEQFIFTFPQTVQYAADHFLTADCNRDAHRWVTTPSAWHAHTLVLHGPARSGKTHLAHIWAGSAGGMIAEASDLSRDAVPDLTSTDIAIEAVDGDFDQTALFHLYNLTREQGRRLLLTARTPPASWSVDLPDLQSRLSAAPSVAISEPDESLIAPLLVKLFADRQLGIPPDVVMFLAARVERTFGAIEQLVSDLDHAAMQEGRRVTLHLARRTLEGTAEGQR